MTVQYVNADVVFIELVAVTRDLFVSRAANCRLGDEDTLII